MGSGRTLLRKKKDGSWAGKLIRFFGHISEKIGAYIDTDWSVTVHHYLASQYAKESIIKNSALAASDRGLSSWFPDIDFTFGTVLPSDLPINSDPNCEFLRLCNDYYDQDLQTVHSDVGGGDLRLGFAKCALPLVLDHNTPNNSVALLWGETEGREGRHAMRPLFRRRQRHGQSFS